ncbi:ATP-binding cassette domain-containing protein [Myxococcota bacterium]|nr:ATP-binding cassette domain-containing protein [Myxococcota bacterium]
MAISFIDVHKQFGEKTVLTGITMSVERGEVLFVVGTSGVGKSVTIKHIIGLLTPTSGEIIVDGQNVEGLSEKQFLPIRRMVAMVFQASSLFDSLTVLQNVQLPLKKHKGLNDKKAGEVAMKLLREVGMDAHANTFPADIGDGMRKRVAIARALALDPSYILFDEPTTGLDPVSARRVDRLILSLARDRNVGCIVVSHDLQAIFGIADKIAMVYQGRIYREGTMEEFRNSSDPVLRQFLSGSSHGPMETPGF